MNALADLARAIPDPLAAFDLDTLLEGAARLRADRLGLRDSHETIAFGAADDRAGALAATFGDLGLVPGETILLAAGAQVATFVALVAGIRAGLHVALAPAWADQAAAARMARLSGAVAIVAATQDPESAPVHDWLPVAAAAPCVRLICSLGAETIDGAVCIDLARLDARPQRIAAADVRGAQIVTFELSGSPIAHRQRTLVGAALDLVARARLGMRLPMISTLPPASFAGLVAGPVASLIAGAPLYWQAPFDARRFLAMLDEAAPAHLVAPAPLAPMIQRAGLLAGSGLASLLLLDRQQSSNADGSPQNVAPTGRERSPPVIDLYGFGERALVPELRRPDGSSVRPAAEPHYLDLDGSKLLAVGWSSESGEKRLEGAAVSSD